MHWARFMATELRDSRSERRQGSSSDIRLLSTRFQRVRGYSLELRGKCVKLVSNRSSLNCRIYWNEGDQRVALPRYVPTNNELFLGTHWKRGGVYFPRSSND